MIAKSFFSEIKITGSFKARGAFNKVLLLSEKQKRDGCVTASSGNHGAASACAMRELGVTGLVFVPEGTSTIKVDAIKRSGCEVRFFGKDGVDTENYARRYATENNLTYLSPYNDKEVINGLDGREWKVKTYPNGRKRWVLNK